jgi:proteasome accessory factor B
MGTQIINRTERLTTIERMLSRSTGGVRVVDIARECDVDRRTIYRDLTLLTEVGLPIYQRDGRYFINHDYYLATLRLNLNEALGLFLAARALSRHAEQQNPHLVSALAKLSTVLSDPVATHVTFVADAIRGQAVDRGFVSVLETVTRAWSEQRTLKLWYSPAGGSAIRLHEFSTYFIEPSSQGGVYAVGRDEIYQQVCAFKLQWIRRVKMLQRRYEIPNDFDPRFYLANAWGMIHGDNDEAIRVVLAFSPEVTPLIKERIWHASQQIEILDDRRCTLQMRVANWGEMLPWILSWGGQVEVLEPDSLREALVVEAARMLEQYEAQIAG